MPYNFETILTSEPTSNEGTSKWKTIIENIFFAFSNSDIITVRTNQ